jgi:hypothetical protein
LKLTDPELEGMIIKRMKTGGFHDVEDVLIDALLQSETNEEQAGKLRESRTGADLIAALQSSPHREIDIEPARYGMSIRDVTI